MRPRILLVDDHGGLLDNVRKLLQGRFEIVGTAANGREAVQLASQLQPDVVVIDIGMPVLNGIDAAREIRERTPHAKLVFLTQQSETSYIEQAFRLGAHAYVLKQAAASELSSALDEALRGRYFISVSLRSGMSDRFDPSVNPLRLFGKTLTAREQDILQLLAAGKVPTEIATALRISVKTVEFHTAAVMDELGIRTMAELKQYAVEHELAP